MKFLPKFYDKIEMNVKPDIEYKNDGVNKDIGVWLEHVKVRYDKKNEGDRFIVM